jgi:hypothetical protein
MSDGPQVWSTNLEKTAIKLCCSDSRIGRKFISQLDNTFFARTFTRKAYSRIIKLMRETGEAPSYEDLCEDPQLEKSVRDSLKSFTGKIPSSRIKAAHLFTKLDNFRRYRVAWNTCQGLVDELRQPTIDTQKLMDLYTDAAQKSVTAHGLPHVTIGAENDVFLKKVRKINEENNYYRSPKVSG